MLLYTSMAKKILSGILFYYYGKLERHFAIVLYTNIAVLSRDFNFQSFRFVSPEETASGI